MRATRAQSDSVSGTRYPHLSTTPSLVDEHAVDWLGVLLFIVLSFKHFCLFLATRYSLLFFGVSLSFYLLLLVKLVLVLLALVFEFKSTHGQVSA